MMKDPMFADRVPPHIRERYESVHAVRARNVRLARQCGVRIAMGTDVGTPGNHCGDNMQELEVMVAEIGMPPAEAIRSATTEAAEMMGLGDRLGALEAGKLADVIAVPADPLADIAALRGVFFVMKDGKVARNDRG
jgi:imidazolonepropionase-like amidohydrolase